jgi:hypothetical protein
MDKTPMGNEVMDFEPGKLPADFLAALGLLSASASHTDGVIEMAIAGMLGIDGEKGWAVTAHMPAPLRSSVLRSAAEISLPDGKALDELDVVLDAIKSATDARNKMVHGSWARIPSTGEVILVEQEARTHVKVSTRTVTADEVKGKAFALYDAGMDLMRFLMAHNRVPDLPGQRPRGVNTPSARKARNKQTRVN